MNIDELKVKHENYNTDYPAKHTHISIEFAISVLEDFTTQYCECGRIDSNEPIEIKIQELKTYLDEKC